MNYNKNLLTNLREGEFYPIQLSEFGVEATSSTLVHIAEDAQLFKELMESPLFRDNFLSALGLLYLENLDKDIKDREKLKFTDVFNKKVKQISEYAQSIRSVPRAAW